MHIALINIPFKDSRGKWIPVPPKAYGGIQWYVFMLLKGYLELGCKISLLGAPFTRVKHKNLRVTSAAEPKDINIWLKKFIKQNHIDIVHDHSNICFKIDNEKYDCPIVATTHFTGKPPQADVNVFVSYAQRTQAFDNVSPVIRVPVDPNYYIYSEQKKDYLLYLGRISPWKGVYEASQFAYKANRKLLLAGPSWEKSYLKQIMDDFPHHTTYVGEIGGIQRIRLLTAAKALMVFSLSTPGPWGDIWCEPGSTVVSEASISGTPVIASDNGCLKEIVPGVGSIIAESSLDNLSPERCRDIIANLPKPYLVHNHAKVNWHYLTTAIQYVNLFKTIIT